MTKEQQKGFVQRLLMCVEDLDTFPKRMTDIRIPKNDREWTMYAPPGWKGKRNPNYFILFDIIVYDN